MQTLFFAIATSTLLLVGCSADNNDHVRVGEQNFTSERTSAADDVPRYTSTDAMPTYEARARISVDGAAVVEVKGSTATDVRASIDREGVANAFGAVFPIPNQPSNKQLDMRFGQRGDQTIAPGTYTCATGDGSIGLITWITTPNAPTTSTYARATSCSVVVDDVKPIANSHYLRVYGRFESQASSDSNSLTNAARGTFMADIAPPVEAHSE